ncbi:hypothetical protein ACFV4N_21745 [Actinosynnema sp. NPDC059797]
MSGARERPGEAHARPAHAFDASEPGYSLADALAGAGRFEDAIDLLRRLVAHGAPGAVEELAALLAGRRAFDELLDRTAKGDEHCARQLVALAIRGELPGGRELLADGL